MSQEGNIDIVAFHHSEGVRSERARIRRALEILIPNPPPHTSEEYNKGWEAAILHIIKEIDHPTLP